MNELKNNPEPEPLVDTVTDNLDAQLARVGNQIPVLDPILAKQAVTTRDENSAVEGRKLLDRLFASHSDHGFIERLREAQAQFE